MIEIARVTAGAAAPAEAIWAILTDFAHPQLLAPSIEHCRVSGEGVGAIRIVESSRGLRIHERLLECDREKFRFQYEVMETGDMPFANVTRYRATVRLAPDVAGCTVDWRAEGELEGPIEPVRAFLEMLYSSAIENLAAHALAAAR